MKSNDEEVVDDGKSDVNPDTVAPRATGEIFEKYNAASLPSETRSP